MKEDLADWMNQLYKTNFDKDGFLQNLEDGVVLCQHVNKVNSQMASFHGQSPSTPSFSSSSPLPCFSPTLSSGYASATSSVCSSLSFTINKIPGDSTIRRTMLRNNITN
jgi:hypothetical protein